MLANISAVLFLVMFASFGPIADLTQTHQLRNLSVSARAQAASNWTEPLLSQPVSELLITHNDRLLAQTENGLFISGDDGATWATIQLPPTSHPANTIVVGDIVSGDTLYVTGNELLYKSRDGGRTWSLILSAVSLERPRVFGARSSDIGVIGLAISPIDPDLLYAFVAGVNYSHDGSLANSSYALVRSDDGGVIWSLLMNDSYGGNSCQWANDLLQSAPTDIQRVFAAQSCRAGSSFGVDLKQSFNQGDTFTIAWTGSSPAAVEESVVGYPNLATAPFTHVCSISVTGPVLSRLGHSSGYT